MYDRILLDDWSSIDYYYIIAFDFWSCKNIPFRLHSLRFSDSLYPYTQTHTKFIIHLRFGFQEFHYCWRVLRPSEYIIIFSHANLSQVCGQHYVSVTELFLLTRKLPKIFREKSLKRHNLPGKNIYHKAIEKKKIVRKKKLSEKLIKQNGKLKKVRQKPLGYYKGNVKILKIRKKKWKKNHSGPLKQRK